MNFESWRDFSLEGEHDIEDAHDRYEKRWMIKENERKAKVKSIVFVIAWQGCFSWHGTRFKERYLDNGRSYIPGSLDLDGMGFKDV